MNILKLALPRTLLFFGTGHESHMEQNEATVESVMLLLFLLWTLLKVLFGKAFCHNKCLNSVIILLVDAI
jgi:hypothetical protein